jgi:hypothetical protein
MIIQDTGAQVYASGPLVLTYISDVDDSEPPYVWRIHNITASAR